MPSSRGTNRALVLVKSWVASNDWRRTCPSRQVEFHAFVKLTQIVESLFHAPVLSFLSGFGG